NLLRELVDVRLAADDIASTALVDERLRLDVVLVANLTDDLLEQIFDRDEARRAAVLVDDDRALRLLALELLQQLRTPLRLRHEHRRPQQSQNRPRIVDAVERDEILDEDEAGDVVERFLEDGKARILLLAEERPHVGDGRAVADGDDVGPR